ncbi:MAG: ribosomal-processing cysteine protease Prp [Clostridiales bacterium]|jgi:uncharacterized protein YsxB (DUF464 family)|nr:ribosomal-processing cysteine protease Prp [Clostridiales bacterium]
MIKIELFKNFGRLYGFCALNHGDSNVCAAVSVLSINTVNCIEKFTDAEVKCDYNNAGGYLKLEVPELIESENEKASLILKCFELGINSVAENYDCVSVSVKED